MDSLGRLDQSAPSVPVTAVLAAAGGFSLSAADYPFFDGSVEEITVAFYRTDVDPGDDAPYYFRGRCRVNNTYADTVGTAPSGEELYIQDGSVLENAPPPPLRDLVMWNGRGMYLLEENRRAYGFTKLVKEGFALQFTELFAGVIDDEYGDITAQAALGPRFLLFKRDAVYWISGDGPNDLGEGSFTEPERLDGPPGTINPRSVVATELGVFYQAPDLTIWLIKPDLSRVPLGDPVSDVGLAVQRAIAVPDKRQVRFHTAAGTTLVYDTTHGRWTTFTPQPTDSACVHGGVAHYVDTDGFICKDSAAAWDEAGIAYQAVLELTWAALGQLAGYMRTWDVHLIGQNVGAHTLTLVATADLGNTSITRNLLSTAIQVTHGYRVEARMPRQLQQNTALLLKIQDNSPTTAGFALEAISLQCGFAPGRRPRLPAAHRMAP
jgi:hypothetical protein